MHSATVAVNVSVSIPPLDELALLEDELAEELALLEDELELPVLDALLMLELFDAAPPTPPIPLIPPALLVFFPPAPDDSASSKGA